MKKTERSAYMKGKLKKMFLCGGLSTLLVAQPLLSYAAIIELPKEKPLKYSEELLQRFEDLKVCVLEAEVEIMGAKAPEGTTAKTCADVMNEYGLSKKQTSDPIDSPYWKDTTELQAAIDLFVKMGQEASGEDRQLKFEKVNDQWDMIFYRIFNMLYEIPKVQGHPMILDFSKQSRDVYLRHGKFTYFRNICYYFYHNNPDKELTRDLLRYVYHLEESDYFIEIDEYIPDENSNVYLPGEEIPSSGLPDDFVKPEDQEKEDLDQAWEETWEEIEKEEAEKNPPVVVPLPQPIPYTETYTSYEVKGDVCMKIVSVVVDGVSQGATETKAPQSEAYNCGRLEDINWDFESETDSELESENVEFVEPMVYYQYGKEDKLFSTNIVLGEPVFSYDTLVNVLRVIADEQGVGSLGGKERYLFAIGGLPLVLNTYEDTKTLDQVNKWLTSKKIPVQLLIESPEETAEDTHSTK